MDAELFGKLQVSGRPYLITEIQDYCRFITNYWVLIALSGGNFKVNLYEINVEKNEELDH